MSPEYSLEGLMLRLKLQYFGLLMRRTDSLEEILILGKIESKSSRGQQSMRWLDSISDSRDMTFADLGRQWNTHEPGVLQSIGLQRVRHDLMTE